MEGNRIGQKEKVNSDEIATADFAGHLCISFNRSEYGISLHIEPQQRQMGQVFINPITTSHWMQTPPGERV